ncbi:MULTISPECIES: T9SS type A sorting domain-containing protein [unclassified Paraflavitalea]|uniref:T9SS type A sorting domain-containing protein n=1 Tax=unclassified Paraflavitalea TaxID=2798305 RepID=UPI003D341238
MRKFYVTMLFAVLATGVANAQAVSGRRLYWKMSSAVNSGFSITTPAGFTAAADWFIKNANNTYTAISTLPSGQNAILSTDSLFIDGRRMDVDANITLPTNVRIIMLGAPASGSQTMDLNNGVVLTMSNTSAIFSIGGNAVLRLQSRNGANNAANYTRIVMGGVIKAVNGSTANIQQIGNGGANEGIGTVAYASQTATIGTTTNQFGGFAQLGALPVVLVNFTAAKAGSTISLAWSTQQEYNSKSYSIERSNDGQSWSSIGEVAAAGYSSTPKSYKFTDAAPLATINYYRVRIIDADGKFGLTPVRAIRANGAAKVGVYPNPASGTANILVNAQSGGSFSVSVFNRNGQLVAAKQGLQNTNVVTLDVFAYSAGEYIVDVKFQDGTRQTSKMMVVKQ